MKIWQKNYLFSLGLFLLALYLSIFFIASRSFSAALEAERWLLTDGRAAEHRVGAVHGDGYWKPCVAVDIETDGDCYRLELIGGGELPISLYRMEVFPDWECCWNGYGYVADQLLQEQEMAAMNSVGDGSFAVEGELPAAQGGDAGALPALLASLALEQNGRDYALGEEGPDSFDASGLVSYCLRQLLSPDFPRSSAAKLPEVLGEAYADRVESLDAVQPGDILFFRGGKEDGISHCGICTGAGIMTHASSAAGKVSNTELKTEYWQNNFAFALRLKNLGSWDW